MKMTGRRRSDNVIDRRSSSGKKIGITGGVVGIIIVAVITLMEGGDFTEVAGNALQSISNGSSQNGTYNPDETDERLATLSSQVLAGTEDVWSREFKKQGWGDYRPPKLVLYHGSVHTGCGNGMAQMGPFYCSADETVYIDLDFFRTMDETIGASGDFTYAYVIAHEVGHHVQHLLGILDKAHSQMARLSDREANKISVRLELQADYFAGVWAHNDNEMFGSIEPGDVENAIDAASKIGDDYLQKKATGREAPETFNHGRSVWRVNWLSKGLETGDPLAANPFDVTYGDF